MVPSTLGQLVLAYRQVWNRARQCVALQLFVRATPDGKADAAHFLRTVRETWTELSPTLLLVPQDGALLLDLLQHAGNNDAHITVQQDLLELVGGAEPLRQAHGRGARLVWRGAPGQRVAADIAPYFVRDTIRLTPGETLVGAHVSLRRQHGATPAPGVAGTPVQAGQIVEDVASRLMAAHCLDEAGAWGVAGWPADDVLLSHRQHSVQPGHAAIVRLVQATDADLSLDVLEHALADEPLLAYRFLRYTNSAAVGLRTGIESLRHGLMVLGLSRFKAWLLEQLPLASTEPDMDPVRGAMVMRARLMEQLLDAGDEDKLRREVFLCGMMSQIDGLLDEPLREALQRLPLSERITGAILGNSGPYAPFLELATALEYTDTDTDLVPGLCATHELDLGEVNRTLLRVLSHLEKPAR